MEIREECLHFLSNHNFIRNFSVEQFILENNFQFDISNYVIYCVGLIENQRIVHVVKFLGQNNSPGVTSYYIQWFNVACFPIGGLIKHEMDSVCFWVHSGVALRKNFFLFQDRMSLLKSSFIYDAKRDNYYRLVNLVNYLKPNIIENINTPIYSSITKFSFPMKKTRKQSITTKDKKLLQLQKSLRKTVKNCNSFQYLEKTHIRLFEEITKIINI